MSYCKLVVLTVASYCSPLTDGFPGVLPCSSARTLLCSSSRLRPRARAGVWPDRAPALSQRERGGRRCDHPRRAAV